MAKRSRLRRTIRSGALLVSGLLITTGGLCYLAYARDREILSSVAEAVTAGLGNPEDRSVELLRWVAQRNGSAKNNGRFLFESMRATATQVLESGGDCADKSRLLAALLQESGIPATMAMCFDARTGRPAHTFVEAHLGEGRYMALDPAYGLYFPRKEPGSFYGLTDLRADPEIPRHRIDTICRENPSACRRRYYMLPSVGYGTAGTINWNRNLLLRLILPKLYDLYGEEVYRLRRPFLLEEPKLLVAIGCATLGVVGMFGVLGAGNWVRRFRAKSARRDRDYTAGEPFLESARA